MVHQSVKTDMLAHQCIHRISKSLVLPAPADETLIVTANPLKCAPADNI